MLKLPWDVIVATDKTGTIVACRRLWIPTIRRFYCAFTSPLAQRSDSKPLKTA